MQLQFDWLGSCHEVGIDHDAFLRRPMVTCSAAGGDAADVGVLSLAFRDLVHRKNLYQRHSRKAVSRVRRGKMRPARSYAKGV